MLIRRALLPLAAALLLAASAQAQKQTLPTPSVVTDPARAAAARDSVLLDATHTRQALEDQTSFFRTRRFRVGHRRTVTRGYRQATVARKVSASGEVTNPRREMLWRRVTVRRRGGVTVERFRGYYNDRLVLKELRHNHRLTYVHVTEYGPSRTVKRQHSLTGEGDVQRNGVQYLVTGPVKL